MLFAFLRRFAPGRERSPYAAAVAQLDAGHLEAALAGFIVLAEGSGAARGRADAYNKCGVARVRLGLAAAARADFEAALALEPRHAAALTNLGNLSLERGDPATAIAFYRRAILADDDYPAAHHNLGVACKRAGLYAEGVRELRRALALEGAAARKPSNRR